VGEFGDKFRKEREKKSLSLDDVSNVTKIGSRMLQAIEEEHFDQLPGGVFNKGFIRAYAKHLGLNDEEAINEYLECLHQAQIAAQASWQPPARSAAGRRPPVPENGKEVKSPSLMAAAPAAPETQPAIPDSKRDLPEMQLPRAEDARPPRPDIGNTGGNIPWGIVAAAAIVVLLVVVLWNRHSESTRSQAATNSTSQPTATTAAAPSTNVAAGLPPPGSQPPASNRATVDPAPAPRRPGDENDVTTGLAQPAGGNASVKPAARMTVVIRAAENSAISITADGQLISQETLIAPAHTSVRASREVVVKVGNAAGISFLFNGKEVPPQGAESESKTFVFDSSGLKTGEPRPAAVN
jgi:cytoskeletal protein RodZ